MSPADRESVRAFLDANPVRDAVVWDRFFQHPEFKEWYVDGLPPRALIGLSRARREGGVHGVSFHAVDPKAAADVVAALPPGPTFYHLTEEWLLPFLEGRASDTRPRPAWLFALKPGDFVDLQAHEVRPLTEEWAPMIAKIWEPDWPAAGYVRDRIRHGPSAAIYEDGMPVAWNLTHLETDRVSMMGFLHVVEGRRGKGYAKSVGSALVKDILRRAKIPALHVYADNVASLELTPRFGFRKVQPQVWGDAVLR